jgi:hypothetical protein
MHFYALERPDEFEGDDGKHALDVYLRENGVRPVGVAYFSGEDACGDLLWSLKIDGEWVRGLWLIAGGKFHPAKPPIRLSDEG